MSRRRHREWTLTRIVLLALLVGGIGGALWHWRQPVWAFFRHQERIRQWVASLGPWGPLASIALNTAQVVLAPIPGQFVGVASGYLFGVWPGTVYSMVGLLLGTTIAMALGRHLGRPVVKRLVSPAQLTRWDGIADRQGPWFFFLVFLLPFVPDDVASFLIGLSSLAIPRMAVLAALGRMPGVFVSCWLGASATSLPSWAWIPLGSGAAAAAWVFWRHQTQLDTAMVSLIRQLGKLRGSK